MISIAEGCVSALCALQPGEAVSTGASLEVLPLEKAGEEALKEWTGDR